ncbi:MAG: ECF transporter S component [Anaerolineae bacterium]|jgi:uncharacterized membrane protein|nr:ECF transporter S component [Anaerolineae bacterium]
MVNIRRITLTALMAALIFVLTTVPRIPVPATGGYVHLGDAGIAFAAAAFGPWVAMAAGGLGTALADLLGFPQWAIFSLIVHGLQGLVMGMILHRGLNWIRAGIAAVASVGIVVGGYFLAGVVLQGAALAALEVVPNTIQALSGSIIGLPLYWAVRKAYPPLETYSDRAA